MKRLILLLFLAVPSWSYTVVQSNEGNNFNTTTLAVAYNSNVTAGNILAVTGYEEGASLAVADSLNGSFTVSTSCTNGSLNYFVAYFANTKAGADTVTLTTSGSTGNLLVITEVSGVAISNVVDVSGASTGFAGATPSISISPANANDFIFGGIEIANSAGSAGTGFTQIYPTSGAGGVVAQWGTNASAGAFSFAFSNSSPGSGAWNIAGTAFNGATGGVVKPKNNLLIQGGKFSIQGGKVTVQ